MTRAVKERVVRAPDGLGINVVEFGGPAATLLLVHGSFGHARVWDFVVNALPEAISAWAMDLPGHGNSDRPPDLGRYAFSHLVEDVGSVIAAMGVRPVLVGHSVGSAIAMHYAARCPQTLRGAVFIDIDPHPPGYQAEHLNRVGAAPAKAYDAFERAVAREGRVAPGVGAEVAVHLATHAYRRTPEGWEQKFDQAFLRAAHTWDARPLLREIRIPALVLRGAESIVMTKEGYEDLMRGLPQATGLWIEGASHQLHLERPQAVAEAIARFCAGLEGMTCEGLGGGRVTSYGEGDKKRGGT